MSSGKEPVSFSESLTRYEKTFVFLSLAILLMLHLVLQSNVDAFWRDEVSTVLVARVDPWQGLHHALLSDSFPALWMAVVAAWNFLGNGAGDWWLRLLGLVISAAVFASMFAVTRRWKTRLPVLAIALLGGTPAMFYWGDSLRAYALACLFIGLLFGWVWSYIENGDWRVALAGAGIAILAAQSNYQNSYLIFGICMAGAVVAGLQGHWKRAGMAFGIGVCAAASLLPYWGIVTTFQAGTLIQKAPLITLGLIWRQFSDGFSGVSFTVLPVLLVLAGLVLLAPLFAGFKRANLSTPNASTKLIYSALTLLLCTLGCIAFIKFQGFPTSCWYYLPILTVAVLAIELTLSVPIEKSSLIRCARLVTAIVVFLAALPALFSQANLRRTSMDLAAYQIASQADERDYVMVNPFFQCVSFSYYYKGRAPWSLLPIVPEDDRLNWSNCITRLMISDDPLGPTFERLTATLKNGGRVWIVNGVPLLPEGAKPPRWGKAPHPVYGWQGSAFGYVWAMEIGAFLQSHSTSATAQVIDAGLPVCHFEDVKNIFVFKGWKD